MSRKNSNIISYYATDEIVEWLEDKTNRSKAITEILTKAIKQPKKVAIEENPLIVDVYRQYMLEFGANEKTYKLTPARKAKLKARLEDAGMTMLLLAISNTANSKFHRGENDRGWKADLDWIIKSYEQVEKLSLMTPTEKPKVYF